MRILAIRGQNLASLGGAFEIDFTVPPLGGTGLFAITGDTGAGKSTLLDALCVALYGVYPRASDRRDEKARDPSGEDLQASDPRALLRRGVGHGFAEVDFVGRDGIEYRASWVVRRARGKASGKLQDAERKLERRDGSAVVASGVRDTLKAVIDRTGFAFDEFRRSVLLAQGDFDAFLLADEKLRADLLERITGTDIYSRISVRVHKETAEREQALQRLRDRRDAVELLHEEALAERTDELLACRSERDELDARQTELNVRLRQAEQIAAARVGLITAQAQLAEAEVRWEAAAADRELLAALEGARSLRPLVAALSERADAERRAFEAEQRHREATSAAEQAVARLRSELDQAAKGLDAVVAENESFAPVWRRAAELDAEIAGAEREHSAARRNAAALAGSAETRGAVVAKLRSQDEDIRRRCDLVAADVLATAAHAVISADPDRVSRAFHAASEARSLIGKLTKKTESLRRDLEAGSRRLEVFGQKLAGLKVDWTAATAERDAATRELDAIDLVSASGQDETLRAEQAALATVADTIRRRDDAISARALARSAIEAAAALEAELGLEAADADRKRAALAGIDAEAKRSSELATLSASQVATRLREALEPGLPCPVCGSTEHPHLQPAGALAQLADELRHRRSQTKADAERAERRYLDLQRQQASAAAEREAQQRAHDEQMRLEAVAISELDKALKSLPVTRVRSLGHPSDPSRVTAALGDIALARRALGVRIERARALGAERDRIQKAIDAVAGTIAATEASIRAEGDRQAQLSAEAGVTQARLDDAKARLSRAIGEASAILAAVGEPATWLDAGAEETIAHLLALGREHSEKAELLLQLRSEAARSATLLATEEVRLQEAEEAFAKAEAAVQARGTILEQRVGERAVLLGGELTESHRTAAQERESVARQAFEHHRSGVAAAVLELERSRAAHTAARSMLRAASEQLDAARQRYASAREATGLSAELTETMLARSDADYGALAQKIATLEQARADARKMVDTRTEDLAAIERGLPEGLVPDDASVAALDQQLSTVQAAIEATAGRIAVLQAQLDRDRHNRQSAAAMSEDIEAAKRQLAIWQDVDAAIGQSDGTKFKRYAQGVTLRHLVALANIQLTALNPRYRLRCGSISDLGLEVVDRDLGDDVRAPRSLSGGERFLVSLALALAMSGLDGRQAFVDTLFIDEGFGSLDRETLDVAIDTLESLQGQGRKVGVVTHVAAMIERIAVQVRVEKRGGGRSVLRLVP